MTGRRGSGLPGRACRGSATPRGTTTTSNSSVSEAIGVVLVSETADSLKTIAPTMTSPVTSSADSVRGGSLTNRARPTVPAAPGTFSTCTARTSPSASSTRCIARAVWSHPPPGAAGATIVRRSSGARGWAGGAVGVVEPSTVRRNRRNGNMSSGRMIEASRPARRTMARRQLCSKLYNRPFVRM